ncbi:MAG TPA: cupin domain-containing protein [Iamia sp.]|nr:cupin domain-containing protein [Iamia sp.]
MDTVENPRTGERITFVSETPDLLVMDVTWTRPGHRAIEHLHPGMEERFAVVEGRAAWRLGGEGGSTVEGAAGTVVVVPPGVVHLAWNPTEAPVRLRIEMRPALRWRAFTTRLFAGEDPVALLAEFAAEVRLPTSRRPT